MSEIRRRRSRAVVVLSAHFPPGVKSGGPVRSLGNMVRQLRREFRFYVITRDRDHGDDKPYANLRRNEWLRWNGAAVFYANSWWSIIVAACVVVRRAPKSLLYFNSLFHPRFTILPLVARRIGLLKPRRLLVAPRGEVTPGALAIRRPKKRAYLYIAGLLGLHRGALWHATSTEERQHILKVLGVDAQVLIGENIVEIGAEPNGERSEGASGRSPLRVVFLSRISPKKNLEFALRVLQRVKVPVSFDVYGPIEDRSYWDRCRSLADALPCNVRFRLGGVVAPDNVRETLSNAHLMLLPSTAENFGHAIAESLAAGTPVVISDQTPWRGLQALNVGWDLSLDDETRFVMAVEEVSRMSSADYLAMRNSARAYALSRLGAGSERQMQRVLLDALDQTETR